MKQKSKNLGMWAVSLVMALAALAVFAPTSVQASDDVILRFVVGETAFSLNGAVDQLDAAPFNQDGRVMVPLRQIGEAIGASNIAFENNVAIIDDIRLPIGAELAGGMGTPVIVEGRTFVPLGYIAQAIGATPRWDGAASAAYIYIGDVTPTVVTPQPPAEETPADEYVAQEEPTPAEEPAQDATAAAADVTWETLLDLGYVSMHRVGYASYSVLPTGIRVTNRSAPQDGVATNVAQIRASFGDSDISISGILFGNYEWSTIGGRAEGSLWQAGTSSEQTFTISAGDAISPNAGGGGGLWNGDDPRYVVTVRGDNFDLKVTGITVGGQDIFELVAAR